MATADGVTPALGKATKRKAVGSFNPGSSGGRGKLPAVPPTHTPQNARLARIGRQPTRWLLRGPTRAEVVRRLGTVEAGDKAGGGPNPGFESSGPVRRMPQYHHDATSGGTISLRFARRKVSRDRSSTPLGCERDVPIPSHAYSRSKSFLMPSSSARRSLLTVGYSSFSSARL
jgi:hypothetical protein